MPADQLALDLPMTTAAPALARRALEGLGLGRRARETALLLGSELVSNAVRHSGATASETIHLCATVAGGALRISVTDAGTGFAPAADPPEPGIAGGFGLLLVDRLADVWGVEYDPRTTVWLVLLLS
ncbi:MAG: ATP-binding protein [Solirubrobacteraceae bacterium]